MSMQNPLESLSLLSHYGKCSYIVALCAVTDYSDMPRPSLMKYHTRLLTLTGDGTGEWTLSRLGTAEERVGIDREITILEDKLAEVENWETRVAELNGLLGIQNIDISSTNVH